jgi:hypothetical protein
VRAIPAWVVGSKGPTLTIQLKTGPKIEINQRKDLKWGDTAYVLYDYEKMRPRHVWTVDQMKDVKVEETQWQDIDNPWADPEPWEIVEELLR